MFSPARISAALTLVGILFLDPFRAVNLVALGERCPACLWLWFLLFLIHVRRPLWLRSGPFPV